MTKTKRQKVWHYTLVLLVFAVTGTTAAIFPRWIMPLTGLESGFWYVVTYILLITPIYQVLLLGYAYLFGKFQYFLDKQKRLLRWIMGKSTQKNESPK